MPDEENPETYEHGPRPAERTPPDEYEPAFLRQLQENGQVVPVAEDWNGDISGFPRGVTWVLYPNGDLQRIGFY